MRLLLGWLGLGRRLHVGLGRRLRIKQLPLDELLRTNRAALAHPGTLAHARPQVVELGAPHIPARGHLDPLDLGGVQRECPLDPDAERLLSNRERLPRPVALALDRHALEHLCTPPGAFRHLEVDP